jgi:RNA polymerase-binding transcription factor DksA
MNVAELKLEIIAKIIASDDIGLLLKINTLLIEKENAKEQNDTAILNEPTKTYERIRVFSEEEQRKINLALQQVENGDYISDEEAQIEIEKWFEEQE